MEGSEAEANSDRYSRQSYSIGKDLMCKLSNGKVLVIGYSTLSLELIKNLALLGIQSIDIHSNKKLERYQKSGMYYAYNDTIPLIELRILNPTININQVNILDEDNEFDVKKIKKYNVVIITNSTFDDATNLNRITHKLNIPFIMTGAYGLMGYLFNDFGETFTINDVDGEIYENLLIDSINGKLIKFKDGHNLSDRDILIANINGVQVEMKVRVTKTPLIIEMMEIPEQTVSFYNSLIKKKIPQTIKFKSLKNNVSNIDYVFADTSVPYERSSDLHILHQAYNEYIESQSDTPRAWSNVDFELFKNNIKSWDSKSDEFKILAKKFCFTIRGDILPIGSIIGAVCAQEVLKALGKKYSPITQWYYMDYYDLIEDSEIIEFKDSYSKKYKSKSKYEGVINVFGKELFEKIQNTIPFIIGSGAIGCEIIKNLGMLGVKNMYLTDMDHIEKSNLSRQFLFNDNDIRKSKALTAANKIKLMNPDTNVIVYEQKVCKETENVFNDEFHSKINVYLNALDNVDARVYVDTLAIKYQKPLIDSGTMGAKGNIQVVIPHLSETYGSTKDPDDNAGIPICTIKSFPFKQAHTIQWARELFETEFNEIPSKISKHFKDNIRDATPSDIKLIAKQLYKYQKFNFTSNGYMTVLYNIFAENFDFAIKELLGKYEDPEKKVEVEGKVLPSLIDIDLHKNEINDFMKWGFIILNQLFNLNYQYNEADFNKETLQSFMNINYDEVNQLNELNQLNDIINTTNDIIIKLNGKINKIDFEKDDDKLGHVDWLLVLANMRNYQYKIDKADLYSTRKIAGNIIPAMITTTSLIAGFQILEYIKLIKYYKSIKSIKSSKSSKSSKSIKSSKSSESIESMINYYKNRFVNLNTNYIDGITPGLATFTKLGNMELSLWDKFMVNTNSIDKIMDQIYTQTTKKIEYLMHGNEVIFDGDTVFKKSVDLSKQHLIALVEDNIEISIYYSQ
jgi:ubiquitin-activating enzyme E1